MSAGRASRCAHLGGVLLACAGALAAATAAPADENPAAVPGSAPAFDQVLRLLAARRHGRVSYSEIHEMAMLKRPLKSSGELVYDAPDHLEKRVLAPKPETLILDRGVLTARRGRRTRVLPLRDYPQLVPFIESIRATLAGDRAALEHYFRPHFEGGVDHWTLSLAPADASVARTVRDLRITGERAKILTVEVRQVDGDRSLLTLGPEIPP